MGRKLLEQMAYEVDRRGLISHAQFSRDCIPIEAAASFSHHDDSKVDEEGPSGNFRGEKLSNTTDTVSRLSRKANPVRRGGWSMS